MENNKLNSTGKPILAEDDIFVLLRKILRCKKLLLQNTIIGAFVGIVFALGVCKTWTSTIVLAPEMGSESSLSGSGSNLASIAGISIGANSTDALYPELYPQIINSTPFIVDLLSVKVSNLDTSINTNLFDYLLNDQKRSWWEYPMIYLKKVVNSIMSTFVKSSYKEDDGIIDPFYLTKEQSIIVEEVRQNVISTVVNKKDQLITISVTAQDPLIAATLVDTVRVRLQNAITDYRTKKYRADMDYAKQILDESEAEYMHWQKKYTDFADANKTPFLTSLESERDYLENQMMLSYNIYSQMMQQYNAAKAKVQERTPSFTTIRPSQIEIKPSSTPKIVVLIGWMFLFFIFTLTWILVRDKVLQWKVKLKEA